MHLVLPMHLPEVGVLAGPSPPSPLLSRVSMVGEEEGHDSLFQKVSVATGAVDLDPSGVSQIPHHLPHQ